ncbi:chromatin remodeling complex subunit [Histoplasma ohiense]|nr:chromatin remodeling complex subunit [Histoplasma ohiense (nom. inval.)]
MTITSTRILAAPRTAADIFQKNDPKPPPKLYPVQEPPFKGYMPPQPEGYEQSRQATSSSAIVIDNGSYLVKAGWSFDKSPRFIIPPVMAKYRDRKFNRTCHFVGYDAYVDATTRGQVRNAFDPGSSVIGNWDVMEGVLDYIFLKLGVDGANGGVDRPIVLTEPIANLGYTRRMMNEILFECYSAPAVAYGIDSLFSYRYNRGTDGLVISSSHASTHVIPVLNSKALLSNSSRLNWGGQQAADFMMKLLKLKYPTFPDRMTEHQITQLVHEHCYVSTDYDRELSSYLDWTGLEDRNRVIQYPFTEHVVVEKTEEELARIAERKKESGRRLQEQAAKIRLEKLMKKEQELEYYKDLQQGLASETKKEVKRILEAEDMKDEAHLERTIRDLERSIKKSRSKDLGNEETEEQEEATFPLLDVPDEELDEAGLKEKRHQRLMKSNIEARQRAKAEKEMEKARLAEEERLDNEKRENNFDQWIEERRQAREALLQKLKEKERLKADLGNRKSLASQMRMKTLANLASDTPTKKRRRGTDDDTFGANDDDWRVYRTVATGPDAAGATSDDDGNDEIDIPTQLRAIEQQLLEHDPLFTENHTLDAQSDWTKSLIHMFLRGPWPFDPESTREAHQLHLNVERIRVPETVFQPSAIAGLDQAGLVEIAADIVNQQRFSSGQERARLLRDVFITGGNSLFKGFDERFATEFRSLLPVEMGSVLKVRRAGNAVLDAWKGAAEWASGSEFQSASVSRQEWLEKGGEYIKEHNLGNAWNAWT